MKIEPIPDLHPGVVERGVAHIHGSRVGVVFEDQVEARDTDENTGPDLDCFSELGLAAFNLHSINSTEYPARVVARTKAVREAAGEIHANLETRRVQNNPGLLARLTVLDQVLQDGLLRLEEPTAPTPES